jgi:hypothetical protein
LLEKQQRYGLGEEFDVQKALAKACSNTEKLSLTILMNHNEASKAKRSKKMQKQSGYDQLLKKFVKLEKEIKKEYSIM